MSGRFYEVFESVDGLYTAEVAVSDASPPWPAFVELEIEPGSIVSDDARALGQLLIRAADEADVLSARAFGVESL